MEKLLTRTQVKREARDNQIKALWAELKPSKGTETFAMESIAENVDCSLTTVRRIVKPKDK